MQADTSLQQGADASERNHSEHRHADRKSLKTILILVTTYMVAEAIGGILSNSLALLADAGHMLSDSMAVALSLFALWVAGREPSSRQTYGYYRVEILAALVNGAALIAIAGVILVQAYSRLSHPPEVQGPLMMTIATGGLVVNAIALWVLHGSHSGSLNVRGVWLHVLSDALGSAGAIAAGGLVWAFGWHWADPVVSAVIGVLIFRSSWALLAESVSVLMEGAPGHLDVDEVRDVLHAQHGVVEVHDLHIWTITSGMEALSVHVITDGKRARADLLQEMHRVLHDRFRIDHITVQIEP